MGMFQALLAFVKGIHWSPVGSHKKDKQGRDTILIIKTYDIKTYEIALPSQRSG